MKLNTNHSPSKESNLWSIDCVNAFSDVKFPPLDDTNPNAVICADELTILLGTEVKSL